MAANVEVVDVTEEKLVKINGWAPVKIKTMTLMKAQVEQAIMGASLRSCGVVAVNGLEWVNRSASCLLSGSPRLRYTAVREPAFALFSD